GATPVYFTPYERRDASILPRIVQAARAARNSIDISMHHLTHPEIFAALADALGRGVRVRLLFDDDDCNAGREPALAALEQSGAQVRYAPTTCAIFQLSHSKYGVFDGTLVINGSANWSKAGLQRNYENFVVFTDEPTTRAFSENFARLFDLAVVRSSCT